MREIEFILREAEGIPFYSCRTFENLPDLYHGFSTRNCGVRNPAEHSFNLGYTPWDSPERVDENRRRFLSALDSRKTPLATLHQVHSKEVHIIKENPDQWNPPEGDALITRNKQIALAVQAADCIPILITDPKKQVVAAIHSGWKGTLHQIALHTIYKIVDNFGSNPENILVAVGPGIRSCCYEVGREIAVLFEDKFPEIHPAVSSPDRPDKFLLDLIKTLEIQFRTAGIRTENIFDLGLCTYCNPDRFFSYRAEGESSGRMMAVIGMK